MITPCMWSREMPNQTPSWTPQSRSQRPINQSSYASHMYETSAKVLRGSAKTWIWTLYSGHARRTQRTILTSVKNKPAEEKVKGVVFQVDCSCGNPYIGETGRTLEVRLKDHRRVQQSTNGIAVHVKETGHDIQWNSAQVLEREPMWWKRRYKEARPPWT